MNRAPLIAIAVVLAIGAGLALFQGELAQWRPERPAENVATEPVPPPQVAAPTPPEPVDAGVEEPEVAQTEEEAAPPCLDGPEPPLLSAVAAKDLNRIRALVRSGANVDVCHDAGEGSIARPLEMSLAMGQHEIARVLLEAGASPNLPGAGGELPLDLAQQKNAPPEVIFLLMQKGARSSR